MYNVKIIPRAQKDLDRLRGKLFNDIKDKIDSLKGFLKVRKSSRLGVWEDQNCATSSEDAWVFTRHCFPSRRKAMVDDSLSEMHQSTILVQRNTMSFELLCEISENLRSGLIFYLRYSKL